MLCVFFLMYYLNYRGIWKVGYYVKIYCPKPHLYIGPCRELIPKLCFVALGLTTIPGLKLSNACVLRQLGSKLFRDKEY